MHKTSLQSYIKKLVTAGKKIHKECIQLTEDLQNCHSKNLQKSEFVLPTQLD